MNVLGLFSGIGGFELGLQRAGFTIAAMCEIDPFCRRVLAQHWPSVPLYEDVRHLTATSIRRLGARALCGGFPCQDVSIAGDRAGLDGERSGLWAEMRRVIRLGRFELVFVENTTGLLDLGMGRVLADLAALGYDAVWHGIPASAVGAAHQRDRIWIVAYRRSERRGKRSNRDREHAREILQNVNRELALSLAGCREQQPNADPLACFGARIPDGGEARAAYVRAALRDKPDGLSDELDAIGALGNAVVPMIPEILGRAVLVALSPSTPLAHGDPDLG